MKPVMQMARGNGRTISFAVMMRELMDGELTRAQLAEKTGLHLETVCRYIHWLHRKRVIHIVDWHKNSVNGVFAPIFTLNLHNEEDVEPPLPKDRLLTGREYRARKKAEKLNRLLAGELSERVSLVFGYQDQGDAVVGTQEWMDSTPKTVLVRMR